MFFKDDFNHLSPNINDNSFLITEKFKKALRSKNKEQIKKELAKKERRLDTVEAEKQKLVDIVYQPKPNPNDPRLGAAGFNLIGEVEKEKGHLRDIKKLKDALRENLMFEEWLLNEAGYRKAIRSKDKGRIEKEATKQHYKEVKARERAREASTKIKPAMDAGDTIGANVARADYRMELGTEEAHGANIENLAKAAGTNFWTMMQDIIPDVHIGMAKERANSRTQAIRQQPQVRSTGATAQDVAAMRSREGRNRRF
jgi:hypothetical protein